MNSFNYFLAIYIEISYFLLSFPTFSRLLYASFNDKILPESPDDGYFSMSRVPCKERYSGKSLKAKSMPSAPPSLIAPAETGVKLICPGFGNQTFPGSAQFFLG